LKPYSLTKLFNRFFHSEKSGGIILFVCTAVSLVLTNVGVEGYVELWETPVGDHSLVHWINDGLMTIFFLLIGLELEREIYLGELSNLQNALFPVFAALGGMVVPAGIYLALNWNGQTDGAGIPMATDIAFALGVLYMLGNRVPASLKVFLTALAVIDDLGAIIVIAVFYSSSLNLQALAVAAGIFALLLVLNRLKVHNLLPYLIGGIIMWYFMLSSGIHATLTGVLLAFAIPFGSGDEKSPSYILQDFLHIPVAYIILPVFALANTCILIDTDAVALLTQAVSLGIIGGLVFGKPLGILLFSFLATVLRISSLPGDLKWIHILATGALGGIGFTMSIFITLLAFEDASLINASKLSVMLASLTAGLIGFVALRFSLPRPSSVAS
jgi:Na+:H+ antiporter, NhaA family